MKSLTSDRMPYAAQTMKEEHNHEFIQSSNFPLFFENHNPNLVDLKDVKSSFPTTAHKEVSDKALGRTTGNDEVEQAGFSPGASKAVAIVSRETQIVAPSPSRRHFCRSPRCAANNPDYAQRAALPPRKYLVSKRHLLQAKGESVPPTGPTFPASAPKGTPHNQIKGSPLPAVDSDEKGATGRQDGNSVEYVACCRAFKEDSGNSGFEEWLIDCEAVETDMNEDEERQVMASVMQQDDDMWERARKEEDALNFPFHGDSEEVGNKICMVDTFSLSLIEAQQEQEQKQEHNQEQENDNLYMSVKETEHNGKLNSCKLISREHVYDTCSSLLTGDEEAVAASPFCLGMLSENCNNCEDSCAYSTRNHDNVITCPFDKGNYNPEYLFVPSGDEKKGSKKNSLDASSHRCKSSNSNNYNMPAFESSSLVNGIVEVCELASESTDHELIAMASEEECKRIGPFMNKAANVEVDTRDVEVMNNNDKCEEAMFDDCRASPVHSAATQSHDTPAGKLQRIFDKRQFKEWRFDAALAEACRKVSHVGEGRVRRLVEAFENIISLTELEAEESRVMQSQKNERIYYRSTERGLQLSATQDQTMCKQAVAASANLHEENFKLPAVQENTIVNVHRNSKMSDESRRILNKVENSFTSIGEHNNVSTAEVKFMVDRYNDEITALAHARSIDKVRNWDYGDLMLANSGYEQWKNLLNSSSSVMDKSILIRSETVLNPTNEQTTRVSAEESQQEYNAYKRKINKEECATPNYLDNEIDRASNFGVSLCNSFQSQRTGTSFGTHSRKSKFTFLQPFALRTESRGAKKKHEFARKLARMFSEEQKMRNPIAQKLPWTNDEPQVLSKPPTKENTVPLDIQLFSDIRACERAEFDAYVAARITLMEQEKKEHEILKQIAEEEEIKRMRREMVPRAQLMPYFDRPFMPKRSSKRVTIPKEPSFQSNQNKRHKCSVKDG